MPAERVHSEFRDVRHREAIIARAAVPRAPQGFFTTTPALPIDLFRALIGAVSAAYFTELLLQVDDISSLNGLIDHRLSRDVFWYSRMGLFQPWMDSWAFRLAYATGIAGSLALIVGYRVRIAAAVVYLLAVSAYRWNFLVVYVDDAFMHLALFWLLLLPIGQTLILSDWVRERAAATRRWKEAMVPGGAMRCLFINLAIVDLIAGLWKLTSPMWRDGTALYAVLRMPISYAPDFWNTEHLPFLRIGNYAAIALELALPAMFLFRLPRPVKWGLLAGAVAMHVGIIATLRVPYANLICIAAMVLVFRVEIMTAVHRHASLPATAVPRVIPWREAASIGFVGVLGLAMVGEVRVPSWRFPSRAERPIESPGGMGDAAARATMLPDVVHRQVGFLGSEHNMLYAPLWIIGIAQSYRLFDWIDDRNFGLRYEATEYAADGAARRIDPREIFPSSLRSVLLGAYLHDVTWGRVPRARAPELKKGLIQRFGERYCRSRANSGPIHVRSTITRLTGSRLMFDGETDTLMVLRCQDKAVELLPRGQDVLQPSEAHSRHSGMNRSLRAPI